MCVRPTTHLDGTPAIHAANDLTEVMYFGRRAEVDTASPGLHIDLSAFHALGNR